MRSAQAVGPRGRPEAAWSDTASYLGTSTGLQDGSLPAPSTSGRAEAPLLGWVRPAVQQWLALLRGLTLAAGSAASCAVAAGGLALLLFLAVTLSFAPAADTFSRRLDLDFAAADLVGQAAFAPQGPSPHGLPPADAQRDARFLAPQQAVDVWVELEVPRDSGQGVAQVVARLTSLDGRLAAKASAALVLRDATWSLRSLALAPLRWAGLAADVRRVRLPLFSGYREKREVPFMAAQVAIKTRSPGWAAEVVSATLKVQLRLGPLRRVLYTLRPGPLGLLLLGSAALAAFLGGGAAALVLLAALAWAGLGGGGGEAGAVQDELSSNVSAGEEEAVEVSSAGDVSDASSGLLAQLADEGEPPPPCRHPGMPAAGSPASPGAQRRKAAPADSAMGSEPGARGAAGGLLRRRRQSG